MEADNDESQAKVEQFMQDKPKDQGEELVKINLAAQGENHNQ